MSTREYKSNLFSMLMEVPEYALAVYNALNNSCYDDLTLIEMNRLEGSVILTIRNDASFMIDSFLNLYEHQSTHNPNMPLRKLIYVTEIFKKMAVQEDLYGRKQIKLPTPKFVVFYNGKEDRPATEIMKLSDSFIKKTDNPELELTCKVYNINWGKNDELLARCSVLKEYMIFVVKANERLQFYMVNGYTGRELYENVIDEVIKECIAEGVLADFLKEHGNEVREMAALDYTWEVRERMIARDSHEEGMQAGMKAGMQEGMKAGIQAGMLKAEFAAVIRKIKKEKSTAEIAQELEIEYDEAEKYINAASKFAPEYDLDSVLDYYISQYQGQ